MPGIPCTANARKDEEEKATGHKLNEYYRRTELINNTKYSYILLAKKKAIDAVFLIL